MKFHEVGNYIAKTNHIFSTMIPLISESLFQKLSESQQQAVLEAAAEAVEWEWNEFEEADAHALSEMEASGIEVTELTDRDAWIDACSSMQDSYAADYEAEDLLAMLRK